MGSKEFKDLFTQTSEKYGFTIDLGGWLKESRECIIVLVLQKSNFGNYYEFIIKIFVQGLFERTYAKNKDLVKKDVGHIRIGEPNEYRDVFDLENAMDDLSRKEKLNKLFSDFVSPFTETALSRSGIKKLADGKKIFLLPAIKEQLNIT